MWVSDAHLGLWVDESDRSNRAASAIMVILLIQWAVIRLNGGLSPPSSEATCTNASFTYFIEAVLVAVEVIAGNMHRLRGGFVVVSCVVCWAVVMSECV